MIVVDTNVLSEAMRAHPDPRVAAWLQRQPEAETFTTAITKAEILYGIEVLDLGKYRAGLARAADLIFSGTFLRRVLAFDDEAAAHYAQISASRKISGRPIKTADAQIAAIARLHGAVLATRDESSFRDCGIRVVNPWKS
jgi:predicted nucleic acid-binding protein